MKLPIYLDYAATTPIDPRVAEKMVQCLTGPDFFGNPSSAHHLGREAARAVELARQQVADLIHCDPSEVIWTSGATEANNLAIKGVAQFYREKGKHLVTCLTEHEAVIEPCRQLEREGWRVTYLQPEMSGLIDLEKLASVLEADTVLVSIMHVNNETGVIQDIAAIGNLLRERGIFFHVDAAQSVGKISINLQELPVDLMSFSAHKIYGPKGAGALYLRQKPRVNLLAQIQGGGQERALRSGTLATHQIVGMGEAFQIAKQEMFEEAQRITQLRQKLWTGIQELGNVTLNGHPDSRVSGILSVAFEGIDSSMLIPALKDLAVSTGSACHANSLKPSRVLKAMGLSDHLAQSSIRFSLGRFTTEAEIEYSVTKINGAINHLRRL